MTAARKSGSCSGFVGYVLVCAFATLLAAPSVSAQENKEGEPVPPGDGKTEEVQPEWPSPLDPGQLDGAFAELPYGKSTVQFVSALEQRLLEQLKPMLRATLDPSEKDELKRRLAQVVDDLENSYVEFVGQETGFAASVIANEYCDGAGESLYKYPYSDSTAYFFFSGSTLWKMFICTESDADFQSLLIKLATIYGDPKEITYADKEKAKPVQALWQDSFFEFVAMAPVGIFGCSRLNWTFLPALEDVKRRRVGTETETISESAADSLLEAILSDPESSNADIIEKIIKSRKDNDQESP